MAVMKICTIVVLSFGFVMTMGALCAALELVLKAWTAALNHLTENLRTTSLIFRYVWHREKIDAAIRADQWERLREKFIKGMRQDGGN